MKKIFVFIAACAMTVVASAQIVSSTSRSLVKNEYANYNRIFVSYSPMSFSGDGSKGKENPFNNTAGGFTFGWLGGWSVSQTMPLYIEAGLNLKYNHWGDENTESASDNYNGYNISVSLKEKESMNFLNLNVPVNISYKYSFSGVDGLSIAPYLGLHFTGNLIGNFKYEYDITASAAGYSDSEGDETELNFFDEDDMNGSDNTANRFQLGWQIGIGLNYKKLYLGIGYSAEFSEYAEKLNTGGMTLTLGLNF